MPIIEQLRTMLCVSVLLVGGAQNQLLLLLLLLFWENGDREPEEGQGIEVWGAKGQVSLELLAAIFFQ